MSIWLAKLLLAAALGLALGRAGAAPSVVEISGPAQGTTYAVTVVAPPPGLDAARLRRAMRAELDRVDAALSTWRDDSDLARFNAAPAGRWVRVAPLLAALTRRGLQTSRVTGGAFEITLAPILHLWGFGPAGGQPQVPPVGAIDQALEQVGGQLIAVRDDPPALRKQKQGVAIELSGIAQGATVDRMAQRLEAMGANRYLVALGGELFGRGRNRHGQRWRVGIEQPKAGAPAVAQVVAIDGVGVSTSGGYRDFFEIAGRRYSHTIDPRTGRPVTHDLQAVTVIAETTERADALATALLVKGPEAGLAYARANKVAALLVSGAPGRTTGMHTKAFEAYLLPSPRRHNAAPER